MKLRARAIVLCALLSLSACDDTKEDADPPATPERTVSWFLDHPDALANAWDHCRNDPGGVGKTGDCINASEARRRQTAREIQDALK